MKLSRRRIVSGITALSALAVGGTAARAATARY
jgi:hypothetical protein